MKSIGQVYTRKIKITLVTRADSMKMEKRTAMGSIKRKNSIYIYKKNISRVSERAI